MKNFIALVCGFGVLAGCEQLHFKSEGIPVVGDVVRPEPRPDGGDVPPKDAVSVEDFDTTSAAERAEATDVSKGGRKLGNTIASLGNPSDPGFWLETTLVKKPTKGRVVYPVSGKSVEVDLIPIEGPKSAGSRISLPALRLLGAPLTGLPELTVFAGGA